MQKLIGFVLFILATFLVAPILWVAPINIGDELAWKGAVSAILFGSLGLGFAGLFTLAAYTGAKACFPKPVRVTAIAISIVSVWVLTSWYYNWDFAYNNVPNVINREYGVVSFPASTFARERVPFHNFQDFRYRLKKVVYVHDWDGTGKVRRLTRVNRQTIIPTVETLILDANLEGLRCVSRFMTSCVKVKTNGWLRDDEFDGIFTGQALLRSN